MSEEFLHYIWKFRLYDIDLTTTAGEPVRVISSGEHNTDAGPDFFNARVRIGNTVWAGNVEIHVKASDWLKHGHQNDEKYDNIILHVVYYADSQIIRKSGDRIPCLIMRDHLDIKMFNTYKNLMKTRNRISCQNLIHTVPPLTINLWKEALGVGRIERKTMEIRQFMKVNKNDFEETFYIYLIRNFGFKINAVPFELLAKSLPLKILLKHKDHLQQLEALLFGQAGMLTNKKPDGYAAGLSEEYDFLSSKYHLTPIGGHLWKFLRLRPSNFPTVRLSQLANIFHLNENIIHQLMNCKDVSVISDIFNVTASSYWEDHYVFGKTSTHRKKFFGGSSAHLIIINTIIPFLFLSGELTNKPVLKERSLQFLGGLPPENNTVIRAFKQMGIHTKSAFDSQGILELYNNYCKFKRCLECRVGHAILQETKGKRQEVT